MKNMIVIEERQEMEANLTHLMFQFRHISVKYDLMVREEINGLFEKHHQSINAYEKKIKSLAMEN